MAEYIQLKIVVKKILKQTSSHQREGGRGNWMKEGEG